MKRYIIFKAILFLTIISGSYLIFSFFSSSREGFSPTKCSQLGDCAACSGVVTSSDGLCAWDGKTGKCRVPTEKDTDYVIKTQGCSRTTTYNSAHTDGIWTDSEFGCPVCPTFTTLPAGTGITAQKS